MTAAFAEASQPGQHVTCNNQEGVQGSPIVYEGPTSSTFSMNTADSRLSNISRTTNPDGDENDEADDQIQQIAGSGRPFELSDEISLEKFTLEDVIQYLETFQRTFGVLHPLPHMEKLKANAAMLLRSAKRSLWSRPINSGQCGILEMFKMVLAIALVAQTGVQTKLSRTLYQSVEPMVCSATFGHSISHDFRVLMLLVVSIALSPFPRLESSPDS